MKQKKEGKPGSYRILTDPSSKCPVHKCDGTGIILIEYPPYGYEKDYGYTHTVAHHCECSGKASSEYRRSRSLLPKEFINKQGKDFNWNLYGCDTDYPKSIVNDFIMNFYDFEKKGFGLYIYSKTKGSGKTMLSCCIANELMERVDMPVKFVTILDFMDIVKKNYKNDDFNEDIKALYKARLLILDDLGVEIKKEHTDMKLYQLINERCNNQLSTIITSNLKLDELKLDERTVDRIEKMGMVVELPNVPIRRYKAEEEKKKFLSRNRKSQ